MYSIVPHSLCLIRHFVLDDEVSEVFIGYLFGRFPVDDEFAWSWFLDHWLALPLSGVLDSDLVLSLAAITMNTNLENNLRNNNQETTNVTSYFLQLQHPLFSRNNA